MRLHAAFGPDGTPRALRLVGADRPEREVALQMLPAALRGGECVIGDKNYAGRDFAVSVGQLGATVLRPARRDEPLTRGPRLAPLRQRIESIFWTCKDLLDLEHHGARTLRNLRARVLQRLLTLTACVYVNHHLGRPTRPTRALVDFVA